MIPLRENSEVVIKFTQIYQNDVCKIIKLVQQWQYHAVKIN